MASPHFDTDARLAEPQAVTPSVSHLLQHSRAAHLRKKYAAGRADKTGRTTTPPNYPTAEHHILEALTLRLEAHQVDPEHMDPAWQLDSAPDADLIKFYVAYAKPVISPEVMALVAARFPAYAEIRYIP